MATKRSQPADAPVVYKPPSPRQMLRMDAERMARDAVLNRPDVKKAIKATTRQILGAATTPTGQPRPRTRQTRAS